MFHVTVMVLSENGHLIIDNQTPLRVFITAESCFPVVHIPKVLSISFYQSFPQLFNIKKLQYNPSLLALPFRCYTKLYQFGNQLSRSPKYILSGVPVFFLSYDVQNLCVGPTSK